MSKVKRIIQKMNHYKCISLYMYVAIMCIFKTLLQGRDFQRNHLIALHSQLAASVVITADRNDGHRLEMRSLHLFISVWKDLSFQKWLQILSGISANGIAVNGLSAVWEELDRRSNSKDPQCGRKINLKVLKMTNKMGKKKERKQCNALSNLSVLAFFFFFFRKIFDRLP